MAETTVRERCDAAEGALRTGPAQPVVSDRRRPELDWLRVALFAGLILYHEGLIYAPWSPWVEKSAHRHPGLEPLLLLTHPWRMSLLFLISGVATRYMADKQAPGALCAARCLRLLPPLAFAFLVLVPIQGYLMLAQTTAYAEGYPEFLCRYFTWGHTVVVEGLSYKLPVYGHLWFVFYLWAYTLALAAGLAVAPGALRVWQTWAERGLSGLGLLIWPMLVLTALRLTAYPFFGVTLGFVDDGYTHLVSGGLFLLGFLTAKSDRVWATAVEVRWTALGAAALGYTVYAAAAAHYGGVPERVELRHPAMAVFYELERWGAIVALAGFARRHLAWSTPSLAYLNGGIFTFYVVHQPAMLLALYWLKPVNLAAIPEAILIALATVATCVLAYELARGRPLLGAALGCTPASKRSLLARARPPTRRARPFHEPSR